jgi:hypothetical protein
MNIFVGEPQEKEGAKEEDDEYDWSTLYAVWK